MKSAQELAAWMQVPFASAAERIAAYADPQYHHPLNDAYRQAIIVKEALSVGDAAPHPELRPNGITIPLGGPEKTLQEEAAERGFQNVEVYDSKFGLSGRNSDAEAAALEAAAKAELEAAATKTDAAATNSGLVWNGSAYVPRR